MVLGQRSPLHSFTAKYVFRSNEMLYRQNARSKTDSTLSTLITVRLETIMGVDGQTTGRNGGFKGEIRSIKIVRSPISVLSPTQPSIVKHIERKDLKCIHPVRIANSRCFLEAGPNEASGGMIVLDIRFLRMVMYSE